MRERIQYYKDLIENNGYINAQAVIDFLRNNCIADFECIAEIYGGGMSQRDYQDLQEALDNLE